MPPRLPAFVCFTAVWVFFLIGMASFLAAAEPPRVLVLYSNDRLLPANIKYDEGMRQALEPQGSEQRVAMFGEFLDAIRFPGEERQQSMAEYLEKRYQVNPPQILVALGPQSLGFFLKRRDHLFPSVPLIYGGASVEDSKIADGVPGVIGLPMDLSVVPTVEALLKMRPQTRELLLVTGAAEFDRNWDATARRQCAPFEDRLRITSCSGLPLDELKQKLAALSPETAVLYLTYFRSPTGETMAPMQAARVIAAASAAPVIAPYDTYIGTGVLGGCVTPFEDDGRSLGKVIRRVLTGETPASISTLPPTKPRFVFDDRQLKRWEIMEDTLPTGTERRFHQPSIWEEHRNLLIAGTSALVIQTVLIAGLLTMRARQFRAEGELRQSEERFAGVFKGCPAAISIIRQSDGKLVDVNPSWEKFYEIDRAEAVEHSPLELGMIVNPESNEQFRAFLNSGKPLRNFEQMVRNRAGKTLWRSVSCELIPLGGVPCYVVMSKNITEEREVEDARQNLAHAMRLATLGELTVSIAHEINQPLGAILSNAEAGEMLMDRPDPPLTEVRQILADIRRDDLRASEVIKRVRALVGKQEVTLSPLDLNEVLAESLRLLSHESQRRGVTVETLFSPDLPKIRGDRVQIEQVLLNLLLNAMDAMKETPLAKRKLTVRSAHESEGWVVARVDDAGHGIDPDETERIFNSFFTNKEDGMGLGLALARSIAEAHSGRVTAENNPSGGASFRLSLPTNGHSLTP